MVILCFSTFHFGRFQDGVLLRLCVFKTEIVAYICVVLLEKKRIKYCCHLVIVTAFNAAPSAIILIDVSYIAKAANGTKVIDDTTDAS